METSTLCNEEYNGTLLLVVNCIRTATAGVSSLLCFASIILLFVILCKKSSSGDRDGNTPANRLILAFLFSALFYSVATVFQWVRLEYDPEDSYYSTACEAIGLLVGYFGWALMLMTFFLIYHLFHVVSVGVVESWCLRLKMTLSCCRGLAKYVSDKNAADIVRLMVYVAVSYVFPALFIWIPLIPEIKGYGSSGYWCWIVVCNREDDYYEIGYAEQALLWYIPVLLISGIIIAFIVIIIIWLVKGKQKLTISCPLLTFPILFLCVNAIAFVNRVVVASGHHPIPSLAILHSLVDPLWGTMAAITLFVYIGAVYKGHRETYRNSEAMRFITLLEEDDTSTTNGSTEETEFWPQTDGQNNTNKEEDIQPHPAEQSFTNEEASIIENV